MKEYITEYIVQVEKKGKNCMFDFMNASRLIRCRDCKYYDGYYCRNIFWGNGNGNYTPPIKAEDGHCDWAERKEE